MLYESGHFIAIRSYICIARVDCSGSKKEKRVFYSEREFYLEKCVFMRAERRTLSEYIKYWSIQLEKGKTEISGMSIRLSITLLLFFWPNHSSQWSVTTSVLTYTFASLF